MTRLRVAGLSVAVVLVSVLTLVPPAAANNYFAIRYWPTSTNVSLSGGTAFRAYDTALISLSYRRDVAPNWAGSLNLDFGGQSNFAGTWTTATEGSNTFWNVNLHRTFQGQNTMMSLFAGYQRASSRSRFGTDQVQTVSGPRVGGDLVWHQGSWGFMGWAAVGLGMAGSTTQPGSTTGSGGGSFSEFGALLIYTMSGWNFEGGYRVVNFGVPAGGSFLSANFNTTGLTVGVSRMWP